ncbi:DoxX subfamily protein [Mycolicibacter nonchromogenicus]|uniref:DoxX subfamily protein n=1 Tax=Mycolicibacter nonchromogenicus TaxID=1782 RepID=A0A1X1ZFB1_MYCNO|nr:DoxX family protein [Mycolicibacter nonchromogenicus]ORW22018.1 DoxX subfamily protein [Mycolicibacter nonchromogenicus]
MLLRKIARPLLAAAFIGQGVDALRRPQQAGQAARPAFDGLKQLPDEISAKVPSDVESFAKANALAQIGGGILLASGRLPRVAAGVLACTVVPGNAGAHMFWTEPDPQRRSEKRAAFLTDVSLIGGLLIAAADTEGRPSLGWRARRVYRRAADALPTASNGALETVGERVSTGLSAGVEHGRELAELVGEKAGPLLESAGERGAQLAEVAGERGAQLAEVAAQRGSQLAEVAVERGTELAQVAREGATTLAGRARRRIRSL